MMTSPPMWRRHLTSMLIIWCAPMVIGAIAAAYKILMYRSIHFNPELEPDYVFWPALIGCILGALVLCWWLRRWYLSLAYMRQGGKMLLYAGLMLILVYVWFRAQVVETRLISRLAYCCCCMEQPSDAETVRNVVLPFAW